MAYKRIVIEIEEYTDLMDLVLSLKKKHRVGLPEGMPVMILSGSQGEAITIAEHTHYRSESTIEYKVSSALTDSTSQEYTAFFTDAYEYTPAENGMNNYNPFPMSLITFIETGAS